MSSMFSIFILIKIRLKLVVLLYNGKEATYYLDRTSQFERLHVLNGNFDMLIDYHHHIQYVTQDGYFYLTIKIFFRRILFLFHR